MDIAVGIINWNSGHWLKDCIASLLATSDVTEIVVVDNASTDRSLEDAAEFGDRVKFIRNESNLGFAGGVNQAFASTSAPLCPDSQSGYRCDNRCRWQNATLP